MKLTRTSAWLLLAATNVANAGQADIVAVDVKASGGHVYAFDVTVRHDDQGWEHYVDRWEILAPDGRLIATRTLYHPHVDEQPFTRRLTGVAIPDEIDAVTVRAHDSVHRYGGREITVELPH